MVAQSGLSEPGLGEENFCVWSGLALSFLSPGGVRKCPHSLALGVRAM